MPPYSEFSDADLVGRVLKGDQPAFATLVERHQESLFRYALGMGFDSDSAADAVQDSLIRAYEKLKECRDPDQFRAWASRILRNRCLDLIRGRKSSTPVEEMHMLGSPDSQSPEVEFARSQMGGVINQALEMLGVEAREAFVMKHVLEYSYEEMAEVTGASKSALKMRVMRAREDLQKILMSRGIDSPVV